MVTDADISCDVLIAGCGVAGLFCALNLPPSLDVILLSKGSLDECDSMLAQGGICVLRDESDYADFFRDTMRAGRYENRIESVDVMIRESRGVIEELISLGVRFDCESDGSLSYTREAAHSRARICHCEDMTGKEITERLLDACRTPKSSSTPRSSTSSCRMALASALASKTESSPRKALAA